MTLFFLAILPSIPNIAFQSYVVPFVTILPFPQVLGEDEFVKCLHSVGVRLTSLKSFTNNLKRCHIDWVQSEQSITMPEIERNYHRCLFYRESQILLGLATQKRFNFLVSKFAKNF